MALVAALALSAVGVASASATTQHWSVGGTKLAEGTPTGLTVTGQPGKTVVPKWVGANPSIVLSWNYSGIDTQIACLSQAGNGTIENPFGGAAGTASGVAASFSGCKVTKPTGQECKSGSGATGLLSGGATEFEGSPALQLSTGTFTYPVMSFNFSGCKSGFYNNQFSFQGSITGISNSASSTMEFTKTSSALSYNGTYPTKVESWVKLDAGGKGVAIAP